jgi:6-phosphogluconolactonase (cycloisomerase 2 family)
MGQVISRRSLVGGAAGLMAAVAAGGYAPMTAPTAGSAAPPSPLFVYVGCYTSKERRGRGEGISVYRMDPLSGSWTDVQLVKGLANCSFLALDREKRFLYSVHGDGEQATAFAIDKATGHLTLLNQQSTGGKNGVSLAVDATNRFLVVGNYSSGTVAVLPIVGDGKGDGTGNGTLAPLSHLVALSGEPGPHRDEQASSHPHDVRFDRGGRFVVVPDKGLDKVFVYRLDTASGKLVANDPPAVKTRPGAGPRHVDFHPSQPYAYVINELDSTITTYSFDTERGDLKPLQVISTLPPDFTGNNTTAEIAAAPSGRFVYGSNRGHHSIAIFSINPASGVLSPVGWESSRGLTPRFFALDPTGTFLYAANQDSDTIVTFRVDQTTGELLATDQVIKTGSPSTIVFR